MSNLKARVELALDEIRPFLNSDGGDIELKEIKKNIVKVQLLHRSSDRLGMML
jgi:Fe-S cluster biogenesis protein NfuA